jgi:hypothetical protein
MKIALGKGWQPVSVKTWGLGYLSIGQGDRTIVIPSAKIAKVVAAVQKAEKKADGARKA